LAVAPPDVLPPATRTRPVFKTMLTELERGVAMGAAAAQVFVAGS
jgi:hypothetical protein